MGITSIFLLCACVPIAGAGNSPIDDQAEYVEVTSPHDLVVAQGDETTLEFHIGERPNDGRIYGRFGFLDDSQYRFSSLDPALCGPVEPFSLDKFLIRIGDPFPDAGVACRYRVARQSDSMGGLRVRLGCRVVPISLATVVDSCDTEVRIGTFVGRRLGASRMDVSDGEGSTQTWRIEVFNDSDLAMAAHGPETPCRDLLDPTYEIDLNIPGGCRAGVGSGCPSFGGFPRGQDVFSVGPIGPRTSASCLVRIRDLGSSDAPGFPAIELRFPSDLVPLAGGGTAFDAGSDPDRQVIGGALPTQVPIGHMVPPVLILLILWRAHKNLGSVSVKAQTFQ